MLDGKQLEALAAVLEHGGFGPAANALNLTLAAVSLRIKGLEATSGQRLLVRGKVVRATAAGQTLLAHIKQLRMLEADLFSDSAALQGSTKQWQRLSIAVNADSLSSWLLPGVANALARRHLLLDVVIDDQEHTHEALKSGDVVACVSTHPTPMRGCVADALGMMRYRCVAAPTLARKRQTKSGTVSVHRLLATPAVIFNRKDGLQDLFLAQQFNLQAPQYPRHFIPAVDAFECALAAGMGWGMVSDLHLGARDGRPPLVEMLPGSAVDVPLYWHHWALEPMSAQLLTQAVKIAAKALSP
jgi:LysR family transcriptional regulator (chromosome initiation inhibitor)